MTSNRKSAIRGRLLGGASGVALLAVSALAVGVALPRPAQATTVNPVQSTTYQLSSGNNPITFGGGANITAAGGAYDAVDGDAATHWTVTNQGSLAGYTSGVSLLSLSTLTNSGVISAATGGGAYNTVGARLGGGGALINQSGGTITGQTGAFVAGAGTVTNAGYISGTDGHGVVAGGGVVNQSGGVISGALNGVYVNGAAGTVTNAGSATISGEINGVVLTSGGSVANSGTIRGNGYSGVYLVAGGSVSNTGGTISGYTAGVRATGAAGAVTNSGLIESTGGGRNAAGVALFAGGSVTNQAGGTITSSGAGVYSKSGALTVGNDGVISGGYGGVYAKAGTLTVTNTGTISGNDGGIYAKAGAASITNSGTISSTNFEAIALNLGGVVDNQTGGVITGDKAGVYSATAATVTNDGAITASRTVSAGVALYAGGVVNNTGLIIGGAAGVYGKGAATTVTNSGLILALGAGSIAGVGLTDGGTVTNQAGGTISGREYGVDIRGAAGTVTNSGLIGGALEAPVGSGIQIATAPPIANVGVYLGAGGVVTNNAGGTIVGYYDGAVVLGGGTVTNAGTIIGAPLGVSPTAVSPDGRRTPIGVGVYMGSKTGDNVIDNQAGGLITGVYTGVTVYGGGAVTNAGTITSSGLAATSGTAVHAASAIVGQAGVFMYAGAGTNVVTNLAGGLISGGYAGVVAYGGGTVTNAGTIVATAHYVAPAGSASHIVTDCARRGCGPTAYGVGVSILGGPGYSSVVTNLAGGLISGSYAGVAIYGGGSVTNAGTIVATGYGVTVRGKAAPTSTLPFGLYDGAGVFMLAGGTTTNTLNNQAGGLISGAYLGAVLFGGGTVTNAGTISGGGLPVAPFGTGVRVNNPTIFPAIGLGMIGSASAPNVVYNQSTGLISGAFVGAVIEGGGTVTNAGTIVGTGAVAAPAGVHANFLSQSAGLLVTNIGEVVDGVAAAQLLAPPVPVQVNNMAGGLITGQTFGVIVEGAYGHDTGGSSTVTNAGVITGTGAAVALLGSAIRVASTGTYASGVGVTMIGGGSVNNLAGGTISGAGTAGVYVVFGAGTVTNAGEISADAGVGVLIKTGGTVTNQAGGTISGYVHGVNIGGGLAGVVNAGLITGTKDSAVGIHSGGYVTNQATGVISGAHNGVYTTGGLDTVTNAGSISGAAVTGVALQTGGILTNQSGGSISGGIIGVYTAGGATSVTNAGTISGGTDSILFLSGGANSLTLQTGGVLIGDAVGSTAEGATNALILQGTGATANAFVNFNTLDVTAGGVWALNGVSTIGATTIDSGNLRVGDAAHPSAQLTSPVTINAGGTLSGHGTVVGSVTNNGGTVSPGGSIGTLTVNGNLTQNSTSTLSLELNPSISSNLVVSGTATLAGTLQLVADPGIYRKGTSYTFLTAGSVTGSFSSITSNNGLLLEDVNSATLGVLTLLEGTVDLPGATPNQVAVATSLVSVPVGASDFDTVANAAIALTPGPQQNAVMDELGGEIDADFVTVGRDSARSFLGGIGDQLSAAGEARGGGGGDRDPWVRAYGSLGTVNGDGNAHGFNSTSGGAIMGASREWHGATVGAALSYGHTDLNLRGLDQKGSFDTGALALYGEHRMGVFFLDAAGSIAYDHGTSTRTILFPGIARRTTGSFDGYAGAVWLSAGARLDGGDGFLFEPSLNLTYDHIQQNAFAEKGGGGADLLIGSKNQDALESTLQAKVSKPMVLANGNVLRTDIKVGWSHEWSPTGTSITEAFAAPGGDAFTVAGATPDKDRGVIGAGLAYDASKRLTYFGRYEATLGAHQSNNALTAGFKFSW